MSVNVLPQEVILSIFQSLDFSDLNSVVQVCRRWRSIGVDPNLWKTFKALEIHPEDLETVLSVPSLSKIQHVKICDWLADEHVETLKYANLKILDISRCYLLDEIPSGKPVNSKLLSEVVNDIEVVNANRANLSDEQWVEIFQRMSDSTRIKTLIIKSAVEPLEDEDIITDLSHINPDVFAKAINKLEIVEISEASLTSEQLEVIIEYMDKNSNIKELGLADNDISKIDSEAVAKALNNLKKLDLSGTSLGDQENPNIFFKQMVEATKLQGLDLGFNTFENQNNNTGLDSKLFARALNKIPNLRMERVKLSNVHAQQFFKRMCLQTWIEELNFDDCQYDESLVNPNFMACGLNKLTKLTINSSINSDQCLELFTRMAKSTNLQYLDFSMLDLSEVPTDILVLALNKLDTVILCDCQMIEDQTSILFKTIAFSTNINHLDLSLVSLEHVPAEVFSDGAVEVETFKAVDSALLKEQMEAILLKVSFNTKLKLFEVSFEDAFVISDEVIENTELEELRITEDYERDDYNWMQFYFL